MRWLVDVTPLGTDTGTETVQVDADTWQNALVLVRGRRGESGPLSGFSIELLDGGQCRALDPSSHIRYDVRHIAERDAVAPSAEPPPPDAALRRAPPRASSALPPRPTQTRTRPISAPAPQSRENASAARPAAAAPATPESPVHANGEADPASSLAASVSPVGNSVPAGTFQSHDSPPTGGFPTPQNSPPAVTGQGSPPTRSFLPAHAPALIPDARTGDSTAQLRVDGSRAASVASHPVAGISPGDSIARAGAPPSTAFAVGATADRRPTSRADVDPVPSQIIFKREQERTPAQPLTYREYVYVVAKGTSDEAAELLLQRQLDLVRTSLAQTPAGKLIHLAVFDVPFHGKPPVAPIATLIWKDWLGSPVVSLPRRTAPVETTAGGPPLGTAPVPEVLPPPQMATVSESVPAPSPQTATGSESVPLPPPQMATVPESVAVPPPEVATVPESVPLPPPQMAAVPESVAVPAPQMAAVPESVPLPPPQMAAVPESLAVAAPQMPAVPESLAVPPPQMAVVSETSPDQTLGPTDRLAESNDAPATARLGGAFNGSGDVATGDGFGAGRPDEPQVPVPLHAREPSIEPRRRARGDDLIADLFEAMHELHFLRDAVDGGAFCLALCIEKIPCNVGIVHLYDIDRREYLVTNTLGAVAKPLLLRRTSEADPGLSAATRKRTAIAVTYTDESEARSIERYDAIGGASRVLIAPVMQAGRFLGALELVDPLDGQPFTETEANAVTYIAGQLADFVAARGVVTDPERISASAR